jgi:hypothetical protein
LRKPARSDQRVKIENHIATLTSETPLPTLTASQAFADRLTAYETANAAAIKAQNRYKRWGGVALSLATIATLIAAFTLIPISTLIGPEADRWISGAQAIANVVSLGIVWWLGRAGAIDHWLSQRADAERLRGELFADLLRAPTPPGAEDKLLWTQKLDLFNKTHIDYQRAYLQSAELRHTKSAGSLSKPRTIALIAIVLSVLIGGFAFFNIWPTDLLVHAPWLKLAEEPVRWQLALGTLASALLAYASARTLIQQDERNAALYRHTRQRLDGLIATRGAAVQAAAETGDGQAVMEYAEAAQAILEADHTAWQFHRPPRDPVNSAPGVEL